MPLNALSYSGMWNVGPDEAVAGKGAGLTLHFQGRDVYLVLGGRGKVKVSLAGEQARTVTISAYKLYTLESSKEAKSALLKLSFTPGVQAYAFTFG